MNVRFESWKSVLPSVLTVAVFAGVLWLLHHEFQSITLAEVSDSFRQISPLALGAALLLTVANYVVLIGYDWLGIQLLQHPLSFRKVSITALITYAVSNTMGALLGGTAVRARLYSAWGLTPSQIARLIFFISLTFWMGLFVLGGLLFLTNPFEIPARFNLPFKNSRPLGAIVLACAGVYYGFCIFRRSPVRIGSWELQPPSIRLTVMQTIVAATDFLLASATLYVLLPTDESVPYLAFTAIFLLAMIVSLVSHVPGGLGVLELVIVTMLPPSSHSLVASLLAFRVIYYLLPLMVAIVAVAVVGLRQHSSKARHVAKTILLWSRVVSPRIITAAVFVSGLILLVSGALPAEGGRLHALRRVMPLPVIEVSHFLGSIIGALLLILARALYRRIDVAWWLTVLLLGGGVVVSLLKGFDYEEALVLSILLAAILPCHEHFHRRGRLLATSPTLGWTVPVVMTLSLLIWLMLFAYRHVEYSHEMWWQFTFRGDAPRSLRALFGAMTVLGLAGVATLLRPHPTPPPIATQEELEEVAALVGNCPATNSNLALLGDKRFIFSDDRQAFIMFGCEGNTWISMGDPIGPRESADDAAWKFREACDLAGVWPAFYQVDEAGLGRYVAMGMNLLKLGEEARVPIANFSLEGSARKDLRRAVKRGGENGWQFKIVPASQVPAVMPQLKAISDAWLGEKSASEKGFSLGYFDEAYLSRFDIAVIEQQGQLIAMANLWRGAQKAELSIDLMRYRPDAAHGLMEYLFTELMLYGHREGYQWFNLGMAPLSGVPAHHLSSWWSRASSVVFNHGERFYNFKGLRNYKEKFDPEWSPKYLASPGGLGYPIILSNVATLISGGLSKLIRK